LTTSIFNSQPLEKKIQATGLPAIVAEKSLFPSLFFYFSKNLFHSVLNNLTSPGLAFATDENISTTSNQNTFSAIPKNNDKQH